MFPERERGGIAVATAPLLSLVIPTRNERESVTPLLDRLGHSLHGLDVELLFVDDSDDGTDLLLKASSPTQELTVLHREGTERYGGLSTAVQLGFARARGEYICVLDADLQHPPETAREMLEVARRGTDIVIASRYVPGGRADGLHGPVRRLTSRLACELTRLLFARRLKGLTDPLSGFFIARRDVISDVRLRPIGFKILLEVLVRGNWATVSEVPYCFDGRRAGISKASLAQGSQFLRHLWRLRFDAP
jgi:glycosyltransferase involved in cell wall biosynthesis